MPQTPDSDQTPCVSCIGIVDFTQDAKWLYCSESIYDLLGFEPHELIGQSSIELVHPDESIQVKQLHYNTIKQDKAAVLAYLRLKHKDPHKGFVLCAISRTVVHNVLAGSVSFAIPGPKQMHNASTAQEVTIITPTAKNFEFRRWNEPSPMPPCAIPGPLALNASDSPSSSTSSPGPSEIDDTTPSTYDPLPAQSMRTLLILDRFSINCHILYCSNDGLVTTTAAMGRSFYDFVTKRDEDLVRSWIDVVKGWGVNERGQPSDGGFGFGKFHACLLGRDSSTPPPEPISKRDRRDEKSTSRPSRDSRKKSRQDSSAASSRSSRTSAVAPVTNRSSPETEILLDAIFSAHSDGLMVIIRKAT